MEIDKDKIRKISSVDDKTFAELIKAVVRAAGGSEAQAQAASLNAPKIKAKMATASDSELNSIVRLVGEKRAAEILGSLGEKGGKNG